MFFEVFEAAEDINLAPNACETGDTLLAAHSICDLFAQGFQRDILTGILKLQGFLDEPLRVREEAELSDLLVGN